MRKQKTSQTDTQTYLQAWNVFGDSFQNDFWVVLIDIETIIPKLLGDTHSDSLPPVDKDRMEPEHMCICRWCTIQGQGTRTLWTRNTRVWTKFRRTLEEIFWGLDINDFPWMTNLSLTSEVKTTQNQKQKQKEMILTLGLLHIPCWCKRFSWSKVPQPELKEESKTRKIGNLLFLFKTPENRESFWFPDHQKCVQFWDSVKQKDAC